VRIGEHLAPAGVLKLRALDFRTLDTHCASTGVDAYWGSDAAHHMDYFFHPAQHGLNLCRPQFDADFARAAGARGATILQRAILKRASRRNRCWEVDIDSDGGTRTLIASVIVDATGRAASFSRRQGAKIRAYDRQIAIVGLGTVSDGGSLTTRSVIEAMESGWWYWASIGSGRCICMLVTDDDLLPRSGRYELQSWWQGQLDRTRHVGGEERMPSELVALVVRSARSQCLDVVHGPEWLAIGDAAMAFDPLASQGIAKAFDHGRRAASAISTYIAGEKSSLDGFASQLERDYAAYNATRTSYYRLEMRWPHSPFWKRRHCETWHSGEQSRDKFLSWG
jgi:flavin-dependent dehydrogenase